MARVNVVIVANILKQSKVFSTAGENSMTIYFNISKIYCNAKSNLEQALYALMIEASS